MAITEETKNAYDKAMQKMSKMHGNLSVLSQLYNLLKDPNSNLDKISQLINSDGILSGNVIRISNSAFYGLGVRSRDVHSAVQKVGLNQVLRLVGIAISKQVFMKDLKTYGISADEYWLHSFISATLCEKISGRVGLDPDTCYLVGLLHAIGRVVINEVLDECTAEIFWDPNIPHEQWEEMTIGLRYDVVGADLLQLWGFESKIIHIIRYQLDVVEIRSSMIHSLLNFVTTWSRLNRYELGVESWPSLPDHPFLEMCGDDDLELFQRDLRNSIPTINAVWQTLSGAE